MKIKQCFANQVKMKHSRYSNLQINVIHVNQSVSKLVVMCPCIKSVVLVAHPKLKTLYVSQEKPWFVNVLVLKYIHTGV